jgi:translocation and assembly module TamB
MLLGEGAAKLSGTLQPMESGGMTAQLAISGTDLALMATPDISLRASPDLRLDLTPGTLKVRGQVDVPFARIDLEQLQSAVSPSSDVVIVDQGEPGQPLALDVDVGVKLGERVRMRGYGLNGRLGGQLQIRQVPGKVMTARGAIDVGGSYKAYGQDLSITRGNIAYAATPLDMPSLDIRAQRKIDDVTVGIQVRGTALQPNLSLWSDPSMEQAEQLSYLVLGKPLRSASQTDGAQLTQAAAAMGGNLLAQKLGARMGLDEVEVADNRALGGAALTVGKYLSPRLYVAYGVALFGSGQVVTFKYLLSRLWNVQIDSGTENRAAINFRKER